MLSKQSSQNAYSYRCTPYTFNTKTGFFCSILPSYSSIHFKIEIPIPVKLLLEYDGFGAHWILWRSLPAQQKIRMTLRSASIYCKYVSVMLMNILCILIVVCGLFCICMVSLNVVFRHVWSINDNAVKLTRLCFWNECRRIFLLERKKLIFLRLQASDAGN